MNRDFPHPAQARQATGAPLWFRATLVLCLLILCSCAPASPGMRRKETLALAVLVSDKETGKPVESAVVHVKGGRNYPITTGSTNPDGEFCFLHSFFSRSASSAYIPDFTLVEIWKEGYKRIQVILRTADYLHDKSKAGLFKELAVPLTPGRGAEKLNLLDSEKQENN